jgi:hypothetical protein
MTMTEQILLEAEKKVGTERAKELLREVRQIEEHERE